MSQTTYTSFKRRKYQGRAHLIYIFVGKIEGRGSDGDAPDTQLSRD